MAPTPNFKEDLSNEALIEGLSVATELMRGASILGLGATAMVGCAMSVVCAGMLASASPEGAAYTPWVYTAMLARGLGIVGVGAGSGPWVAEATNIRAGGAVAQTRPGSCVSACGEMLTEGARTEAELLSKLGEWSTVDALAKALGPGWHGGGLTAEDALTVAQHGPIGAVLYAQGARGMHMVVISPMDSGKFLVRDPWGGGSTYEVTGEWIMKYVAQAVFK